MEKSIENNTIFFPNNNYGNAQFTFIKEKQESVESHDHLSLGVIWSFLENKEIRIDLEPLSSLRLIFILFLVSFQFKSKMVLS